MANPVDLLRFVMKGSNYFKKPRLDTSRLKDPALYSGYILALSAQSSFEAS